MKITTILNSNNKALLIQNKEQNILQSYNTQILEYNEKTNKIKFLTTNREHLTQTTLRHINLFFTIFQLPKLTKQEIIKTYFN